jgi:hypothetical protein
MRKRQDDPASVPLVDLLEAADVATPGALIDLLAERGDAVLVDPLGRLAVPPAVAERLRQEQEERERIAMEEAKRAEEERLRQLREHAEREEELRLRQLKEQALRERIQRVEQATGLQMWQLEQAVTKSRTGAPSTGLSYAGRAIEDERPVTLGEVEQYVVATFGAEVLEGDNR